MSYKNTLTCQKPKLHDRDKICRWAARAFLLWQEGVTQHGSAVERFSLGPLDSFLVVCVKTYLTSLPLVSVRHHGHVTRWKSRFYLEFKFRYEEQFLMLASVNTSCENCVRVRHFVQYLLVTEDKRNRWIIYEIRTAGKRVSAVCVFFLQERWRMRRRERRLPVPVPTQPPRPQGGRARPRKRWG